VAASTELSAGDKRAIFHKIVCGITAAIVPNRPLYAVFLSNYHKKKVQA